MVSALAAQLAEGASLNAAQLLSRSRRRNVDSYLFSSKEAEQHDLESIYALGINGFSRLRLLAPALSKFEEKIFSDAARDLDRTLIPKDESAELDRTLRSLLRLLSPYVLDGPAGRVFEWLVRRFRINEFNIDDILACFLPFHESASFVQMLAILHIPNSSMWSFLLPLKTTGRPLPREILVSEMASNTDLARFVSSLLPSSLELSSVHRALIAFNAAVMTSYISVVKPINEGVVAFLLPALTKPLRVGNNKDCILASYILLAQLSQKCRLSPSALNAVIAAVLQSRLHAGTIPAMQAIWSLCSSQDELGEFPPKTYNSFIEIPGLSKRITESLSWRGAEKVVRPLITASIQKLEKSSEILLAIINSSSSSTDIIQHACTGLFQELPTDVDDLTTKRLLSAVYQRHSDIFHQVSNRFRATLETNASKEVFDRFLISLSFGSSSDEPDSNSNGIALAPNHDDPSVRAIGIRNMLETLVSGKIADVNDPMSLESMRDTLLSHIEDPDSTVISAVYSNPTAILDGIASEPLLGAIQKALKAPELSRSSFRSHFAFLAKDFSSRYPQLVPRVFRDIAVSFLLFTKPRQRTASIVWDILGDSALGTYELLKGCAALVTTSAAQGETRGSSYMGKVDMAVCTRIADNIRGSNDFAAHLELFVNCSTEKNDPHTRNLALLVLRSVLSRLAGDHQISASLKVLRVMGISDSMDQMGRLFPDSEKFSDLISDEALAETVVLKPNSSNSTLRLQASILALLPVIPCPVKVKLYWLASPGQTPGADPRGERFVQLARSVYILANSASSLQAISAILIRALFVTIGDRSLLLLAGVWSDSSLPEDIRATALLHGSAFLQANLPDGEVRRDFQVIVPSLMIAFHSSRRRIRENAAVCVRILGAPTSSPQRSVIYGFESVYGKGGVQYLDWVDFQQFIKDLGDHCEHSIVDETYVEAFNRDKLQQKNGEPKKESGRKLRVLCYLLSHVVVSGDPRRQLILLKSLRGVNNEAKLTILSPLLRDVLKFSAEHIQILDVQHRVEYCTILFECFDSTAIPALEDQSTGHWTFFLDALRLFNSADTPTWLRLIPIRQLERLYPYLKLDHQAEACVLSVEMAAGSLDGESYAAAKECVKSMLTSVRVIIRLLKTFQPKADESAERATKRPRVDKEHASPIFGLAQLTCAAEVLTTVSLPGHVQLVVSLLETLGTLVQLHTSKPDLDYLEQLFLSVLESAISGIEVSTSLTNLRVDVLVELIRVTDNPQTFQQALLLVGSMIRLAPESVLHNVMPIFTFMGANVFHRDDSYSFKVVQKTIESIVPALVTDLKHRYKDSFDLFIGSRDFLRVFTDSATHVPKHRRNHFFIHLVETLGPSDFLAAIIMLLVDKSANRVVKQKGDDVIATLGLPLLLLHPYSLSMRMKAFKEILEECERLLSGLSSSENVAFLEQLTEHGDHSLPVTTIAKRQIIALATFVGHAWSQISPPPPDRLTADEDDRDVQSLVAALVRLAVAHNDNLDLSDINIVANASLAKGLRVIYASQFIVSVLHVTQTEDEKVNVAALHLLGERLPAVAPKTRSNVESQLIAIIEYIQHILLERREVSPLVDAATQTLQIFADTALPSEEGQLAKTVSALVEAGQRGIVTGSLFRTLRSLALKLGPRLISNLKDIIRLSCDVLQKGPTEVILQLLSSLLHTVPSFWGPELQPVIHRCLDILSLNNAGLLPAVNDVLSTIPQKIPSRSFLPAMIQIWDDISSSLDVQITEQKLLAFLTLYKEGMASALRTDVQDHIRSTFRVFLEMFDLRGRFDSIALDNIATVEASCTTAFLELVSKLNEISFKPIFRRLHDWAFTPEDETRSAPRRITFSNVMVALLEMFKDLMTPYMVILQPSIMETLQAYVSQDARDVTFWSGTVQVLRKSFVFDEGAYWRDDRLEKISSQLINQIPVWRSLDGAASLADCLADMARVVTKEGLLKSLNLDILMHTRSEDEQIRLAALACAEAVWEREGMRMIGLTSDTVPFIAECAEDDHDEVAKAARKLKRVIEKFTGPIDI